MLLGLSSQPLGIIDQLSDRLDVVWGALIALVVVILLTPAVGGMARRLGIVDLPGGRRINTLPVPRLGGLALFLGILVPTLAFLHSGRENRGLLLGAAVAVTVGIVDDFRGLPWFAKLGGQLAAAGVATGFGIWVHRFTFPFIGIHGLHKWVGVPLTIVWIVAIMNMVNFLDGLDGLAAGVTAISGMTFSVIALSLGKVDAAVLSAIVFGACVGFLRHNFYPARIFMGDSGALLLGYLLATVAVQGLLKTAATVALFFPLLVLAVPIVDTSFVIVRRMKHGEKLFVGDQAHIHHRFLRRGFSQRRAAITIWAWCLSLSAAAFATRFVPFRAHGVWHLWWTLLAAGVGLFAVLFSVYVVYVLEIIKIANPIQKRRRADDPLKKSA
ncbi:MAG: UDP-GlcNAc:undecaprenyl-phosphate/decaprenyl-phosphate GlcNAc-phosphate transferase [Gaiellaceae bacterium]|nr:UDP-GlcNAc:undecaprenyl-phosphate/decaprenyl-phosphate GlcNAc-phosphate transferase [Gaiellaceae bacterium]